MYKIPLIKNTFYNENEMLQKLSDFILSLKDDKDKRLSMSEHCKQFETDFAKWQGRKYAVLVNSGGSANLLLLQALKNMNLLKVNNKVGFSAITWATNVMPIMQMGFEPIPIDCKKDTLNIDISDLKRQIKNIKCLFITNALGLCADLKTIKELCYDNGVILLEDNCESIGSQYKGINTGNFGLASTFSFFVGHQFSCVEGGMICTNSRQLYEQLVISRANGWVRNLDRNKQNEYMHFHECEEFYEKYTFYDLAFNLRPTEFVGFIGVNNLLYLDNIILKRYYNFIEFQSSCNENDELVRIDIAGINLLSSFSFPIVVKNKERLIRYQHRMERAGIETRPLISGNICHQPFWKKYIATQYELPGAEYLHEHSFYIGNYPEMETEDFELIRKCING